MWNSRPKIIPKNPNGVLYVLLIGRISTPHQDLSNIEASFVPLRPLISELYDGEVQIKQLGERGSGMDPMRESIREAEDEIDSGIVDLVIMEDLSRAHRNMEYMFAFVFSAVDHCTRIIAPGDSLDTADDNWEAALASAAMRHGMTVPDARRRVRRTANFGFAGGGMVLKKPFGYRKLTKEEANGGLFGPKGLRIAKLPDCTPIILEMKRRVERGDSYPAVAAWLNSEGIPPGPCVKLGSWTGRLVNTYLRSALLSGTRTHRLVIYQRIFKTGKFKQKKNPSPEHMYYAELAHMSLQEQQALWEIMDARDPKKGKRPPHSRKGTARADTLWPGQHIVCPFCRDLMYWNSPTLLKCQNTLAGRRTTCWNQVLVNSEQIRQKLIPQLLAALSQRHGQLDHLIDSAWAEFERSVSVLNRRRSANEKQLGGLQKDAQRLAEAIAKQPLDTLIEQLSKTEQEIKKLKSELAHDQKQQEQETRFLSRDDIAARLLEALLELSRTSFEFRAVMREMFPEFYIQPVQALDTPQVHPRVVLWLPDEPSDSPDGPRPLRVSITINAFDSPVHITNAQPCWQVKQDHPDWTLDEIAEHLSINRMTVKRSLNYTRLMRERGTSDPYVELTERPANASRWRVATSSGDATPESSDPDAA